MAKKSPSRGVAKQTARPAPRSVPRHAAPPPVISGRWMAGALGIVLVAAAVCVYATLCLLFYQGQWQLVLHPSRTITATPAAKGMKFDDVKFSYTETGQAQLDGWWVPAGAGARWSGATVLYLHGGSGSLSDTVDDLAALHSLGINVFSFDYRGFGRSAGPVPHERRMDEDGEAAWTYLNDTRHIAAKEIVVYGVGVGASIAAEVAARHNPAGLVLDGPSDPARKVIEADARARIVPGWLVRERFDPEETLRRLAVPKLFLDR
ncbi:MAG: alpha/beta fold hydrolase, partial [Silvibacterium sp.]|nr:alpha/beta fold hydrolase [Silvibacterium sp.]